MCSRSSPFRALHRIHKGSPTKVKTPKRVFDIASQEGTAVYRARCVTMAETLEHDEIYITHCKVRDDSDCSLLLARIDTSETVIVSESLAALAEDVDTLFQSISNMPQYRKDVELIMACVANVPVLRWKASFYQFAYAIFEGCKVDGPTYDAIQRSGMDLFWEVLQSLADDQYPSNQSLKWISECRGDLEIISLQAFVRMFHLLQERHQKSHPFSFIGGDVETAISALEILKYLADGAVRDAFADVKCLMRAAIPILEGRIADQRIRNEGEKVRLKGEVSHVLSRMPRRRLAQ